MKNLDNDIYSNRADMHIKEISIQISLLYIENFYQPDKLNQD